jgi:ABC-type nitrate/sulfonate/bicarbonate transport system ATPase subunit
MQQGSKYYRVGNKFVPVFENLNLEIKLGNRLAIMGPNGCGKSTLINILVGIEKLDNGKVDLKLGKLDLAGVVLQNYRRQLLPWATVESNMLLPFESKNQVDDQLRILSKSEKFLRDMNYHISFSSKINHLSGGEQQAVVLARALAYSRNIFLWDEPFSAIDYGKRQDLYLYLLEYWRAQNSTVLLVTHNLDDALVLANQLIVFDERMSVNLRETISSDENGTFKGNKHEIWSRIIGRK